MASYPIEGNIIRKGSYHGTEYWIEILEVDNKKMIKMSNDYDMEYLTEYEEDSVLFKEIYDVKFVNSVIGYKNINELIRYDYNSYFFIELHESINLIRDYFIWNNYIKLIPYSSEYIDEISADVLVFQTLFSESNFTVIIFNDINCVDSEDIDGKIYHPGFIAINHETPKLPIDCKAAMDNFEFRFLNKEETPESLKFLFDVIE